MLALTRKKGQSVMIGDNIVVKILKVSGPQVSLGIQAPGQIIVRGELRITEERRGKAATGEAS